MKRSIIALILLAWWCASAVGQTQKLQKLAQTGMKFLSVTTDARTSAMGEAATALEGSAASMFFNPSGLASLATTTDLSFGQVNWIADIKYFYGSAAFGPARGKYGVVGLSVLSVDYGDFKGTIRDVSEKGYKDTGTFSPSAMAVGIGYARALSMKFSVGGVVKYVTQNLGSSIIGFDAQGGYRQRDYEEGVLAYDFGILYRTGFRSLNFGMSVRNFAQEVRYEVEGFQLPLTFKIGLAMDLLDLFPSLRLGEDALLVSVDASHPRDYPEQVGFGAEYVLMNTLALRAGYAFPNDEHGFSAGFGLQQRLSGIRFGLDYAYTPFGLFNEVHRFSVRLAL
ncbi:MAG: PorV/PorQ family protein [candidate division KSB1 bacterium]|nr:PorV/PorQ family protein [candidate division KSB1 bacterium]MDZ7393017.1 PorV/PorQ family protein [candidate division KSB1 bacterium]MDZ7412104.1 PorV/PorQ family protein [candidate division KSB1 bacterium]